MKYRLVYLLVIVLLVQACGEENNYPWNSDWDQSGQDQGSSPQPEDPQEPETPLAPEFAAQDLVNWTDVTAFYGELPSYITIKISPSVLVGKKAVAYIAVADMTKASWDVWSVKAGVSGATGDSFKTMTQVYDSESCPVVINGGYFFWNGDSRYTSSLAVSGAEVIAYNINYASEDWVTIYNPTRAAFLELDNGIFDACWTYVTPGGIHYMYPTPAENSWNKDNLPAPSENYPEGCRKFAAKTGIGGGPVLINDGNFIDSYVFELFDGPGGIGPCVEQPRTAIGVTSNNQIIFFVCEGRGMTEGVSGLTTADVANVLLDLGCVEAINLDGGGSTCMLVNGKETIKVSDGAQRAVASAVILK